MIFSVSPVSSSSSEDIVLVLVRNEFGGPDGLDVDVAPEVLRCLKNDMRSFPAVLF